VQDDVSAVRPAAASRLRLSLPHWREWLPVWSKPAAMRAARATVVMPGTFAFAMEVLGNRQIATFCAFGGFATLVLASFGGSRRDKLVAHVLLALAGSVLLTIGTAVNGSTVLAALVTVPVAFVVFFAGVCGPNAASGATAAMLAYVLPAASPGTISMVPDRLAGWWLVSVVGTAAVLLFSPPAPGDRLRASASKFAGTLADKLDAALAGADLHASLEACIAAKHELLDAFTGTPYRPTGLATRDQALANIVQLLEWCGQLVVDGLHEHEDLSRAAPADRELLAAAATALREDGALLLGGDTEPDLEELERLRAASSAHMGKLTADDPAFRSQVELSFHSHAIALAVRSLSADTLVACGRADLETIRTRRGFWYGAGAPIEPRGRRLSGFAGAANVVLRHTSVRSVWFVNSARAALAIAVAVAVADLTGVQQAFWVVLGTLSVLRTNAAGTGATALRALGGTALGFAIGAPLLLAIGTSTTALWIALPIAVSIAAYAPGTAPFAIGQAAFTIVIAVLFNLIVPVGWRVGEVRVEDVAIGCAVSIAVGTLFWPHGVSAVVGDDLADVFRRGSSYLLKGVDWAVGLRGSKPDGGGPTTTAALRLDDAIRGYLSEQGSKRVRKVELWRLIGGSLRLRLTAHALAGLPEGVAGPPENVSAFSEWTQRLGAWFEQLAAHLGRPPLRGARARDGGTDWPELPSTTAPGLEYVTRSDHACYAIWVQELLGHISDHLGDLLGPAEHLAAVRRRPWWR
jgi:uncharacterized membrane protein YccC